MNVRHHVSRLTAVAISVGALVGCVLWARRQEAPQFPTTPGHWALLIAAVAVYAAATVARGWRWHQILKRANVVHQTSDAYGLTVVGYMGNTVLPARGGELMRMVLMSQRSSGRRREILGAVLPERLLDAGALAILFIVLTLAGVAGSPAGATPAYVAAGVLLAAAGALVVYLRQRSAGRLQGFADRMRPVLGASRTLVTRAGVPLALLSVAVWGFEAIVFWLVCGSVSVPVSVLGALFVVVLGSLLALVPAAPGYVGTYDAALLFGLHALGVTGGTALGCTLMFRFVVFVPITLVGLLLMVTRYGGPKAFRAAEARPVEA
jgi:uncharacterized membrane protein YbhN (UPF0104 family)